MARPAGWEGTTRHEFLHALGVHHEHQNMRGPCQAAFRWEDDLGYQPTRDQRGAYIADADGLRPASTATCPDTQTVGHGPRSTSTCGRLTTLARWSLVRSTRVR